MDADPAATPSDPGIPGDRTPPRTDESLQAPTAPASTGRRRFLPWLVLGGLVVGALIASQIYLVATLADTTDELAATRLELADLEAQVSLVDASIEALSDDLATTSTTRAPQPSASAPPAQSAPVGFLPQFDPGRADQALGLRLGAVTGPDAYTGATLDIDPADGSKRIWMVWAHWCPYCQQELPVLADRYPALVEDYPDIDIATVTSSIDPSRGNPLDDYLEAEQFPFPVVVDEDLRIAGQLGVNAYPFWVVTDGDGTVLLRVAGAMSEAQFTDLVSRLDGFEG